MNILSWLLLGLVVGGFAKLIMPGPDPGGFFVTIGIGMAGAFIGGYGAHLLGFGDVTGFDLTSLGLATAGSVLLLATYRIVRGGF
ncbi:MAG: GlsB/YeaQ/YmgE family stress response membrane protein [Pseudomonadales bacterium]|nr:GlsB/YeaQ/YmgE family stress response membrane protein [Pseudomonadales bacterium]NIX08059.1 GlsB/YeaQ/YmgE family stress response membrane protein [Pseudomonadales bacterium]